MTDKPETTHCGNCRYWKERDYEFNPKRDFVGVRECTRIHPLWEAADWIYDAKDGEPEYRLTEDGKQSSAFVQDGSEYMAVLFTKEDFSCKLWKEIPNA